MLLKIHIWGHPSSLLSTVSLQVMGTPSQSWWSLTEEQAKISLLQGEPGLYLAQFSHWVWCTHWISVRKGSSGMRCRMSVNLGSSQAGTRCWTPVSWGSSLARTKCYHCCCQGVCYQFRCLYCKEHSCWCWHQVDWHCVGDWHCSGWTGCAGMHYLHCCVWICCAGMW